MFDKFLGALYIGKSLELSACHRDWFEEDGRHLFVADRMSGSAYFDTNRGAQSAKVRVPFHEHLFANFNEL